MSKAVQETLFPFFVPLLPAFHPKEQVEVTSPAHLELGLTLSSVSLTDCLFCHRMFTHLPVSRFLFLTDKDRVSLSCCIFSCSAQEQSSSWAAMQS